MVHLEIFLKFDPRYGEAETLDRRVFDAALEYYSFLTGKEISGMTKEDAYSALITYRSYTARESMRWIYLEHKVRALLHDGTAWTPDSPSLKSLKQPTVRDIPLDIQFQVFRRDQFSCRYCGTKTKEIEIDFRVPPEDGGQLEADNLITSCVECKNKALIARARTKKR